MNLLSCFMWCTNSQNKVLTLIFEDGKKVRDKTIRVVIWQWSRGVVVLSPPPPHLLLLPQCSKYNLNMGEGNPEHVNLVLDVNSRGILYLLHKRLLFCSKLLDQMLPFIAEFAQFHMTAFLSCAEQGRSCSTSSSTT